MGSHLAKQVDPKIEKRLWDHISQWDITYLQRTFERGLILLSREKHYDIRVAVSDACGSHE